MSTSVLPQLLEVDSELSAQAISLEAQLAALQEKRKGIQTVIAMFESSDAVATADLAVVTSSKSSKQTAEKVTKRVAKKAVAKKAVAKKAVAKKAVDKKASTSTKAKAAAKTAAKTAPKAEADKGKAAEGKVSKTTKTKTSKVKATRGRPPKAKASKTASSSAVEKTAVKRSGRTANWQKYVQDSYSKAALPDVIVGVLKAQPDNIFKIADVMNTIFKEDMPKTHFLKARNRVSNILSAGARDGDWFRGRGGTYSASEKAVKAAG